MVTNNRAVDGQNIVYHYIQKNVLTKEDDFSKELIERLLTDLSIWIPPSMYQRLPVVLPFVVRDNSCRPRGDNLKEQWGSCDNKGFLRDDNSLIKSIVKSFTINSPDIESYNGKLLGNGFVACHIWGGK